ncbi:PREDICTED: dnaJ homolog subfamily B member 9-like [Poecilia mexicana]|uniref:DnaJ homolog subfamily B member 9 n=1 Tax=Poecilia mexicana TaxID=48701 RepID=A0A3B3YAH7_9TELE|nr:PREDICTED: dnaJ homolog subfamily B member 9-like [Poecilia mexicana]XP_014861422.1 PREDICTED: dnaJ homolog subfamily B member 9-like [Poecilia mexicana]
MAAVQSVLMFAVCVLVITELILAKKDYYDILGVPKGATERQIKKAFHRLAMKFHPDKNKSPDAEVRFREIAEAYEVLSDESRRREYDQFGDDVYTGGETQRAGTHQPFTFNFDDMFKDFNIYSQNRHSRHRRHFEEHSKSHKESHSRRRRHFQGGFGAGILDDMFDDMDRMFTFDRNAKQTEGRFHGTTKQHCRTVTQRRGNMVTTYTDCTAS